MNRLKELRLKKNVLQKDVAEQIGVNRTSYVRYEKGQSEPDFDTVSKLADYFEVTIDYLLGHEKYIVQPSSVNRIPVNGKELAHEKEKNVIMLNRLRELRQNAGLNQCQFAKKMNISQGTLSNWENGMFEPDIASLRMIADYFKVTIDYLICESNKKTIELPKSNNWIPVLGKVQAGTPVQTVENILDYEEISDELAASGEYVALKIKGSSMEPKMSDGDVVIVRLQEDIENGQIAVVMVNGDEATVKKIKNAPEGIILIPLNPSFETMFYSQDEIQSLPVRIFGRVVELRAKF